MKTLVIITGAAKGIGSAIFNHFIDSIDNDASFLLFDKDLISTHHDSVKCMMSYESMLHWNDDLKLCLIG